VLLMLIVACLNVGTLIYARTATRDAEIAVRHALGASRGRIVTQLFVEALVLASMAAVLGLTAAHFALKWGVETYYAGQSAGMPFWLDPGLKPATILYAAAITLVGAGTLGILPALKATGSRVQGQLRNLGSGGSTLRFGKVWTGAMIAQVAITVVCVPPAIGISEEAWRDRGIRGRFPTERYLAVRIGLEREAALKYEEFARVIEREPGVLAVTFGDRLPGMSPRVRRADIEAAAAAAGRGPQPVDGVRGTGIFRGVRRTPRRGPRLP
jgi:hypothetical protein